MCSEVSLSMGDTDVTGGGGGVFGSVLSSAS